MVRDRALDEHAAPLSNGACPCGATATSCPFCAGQELPYWCDTCRRAVAEKRCPLCGLKARKFRGGEH